ncbi:S8 family serine peptidase [Amycolatopsis australiensis]|nr:S8 family serine peptidase [Amycolatopsis australiensis]
MAAVMVATGVADPVRRGEYWLAQLHLEQAWQYSEGAGVVVGVIDTGVNSDHPDLAGAVLPGRAFPDLGSGTHDDWGHGTTVAVLIAGRGHGQSAGTLGVAPKTVILPAKLAGGAQSADDAIHWVVDHGAKVVNLSLGGDARTDSEQAYDDGLRYAAEHDVVVVAAAGNRPHDAAVVSPANRPGVIAVSAVDASGTFRDDISVQGPEVALAAPGADITTLADTPQGRVPRQENGTSFAAAIVSGTVALLRAKYPQLDATAVTRRLTSTARRPAGGGRDSRYGFGVVDPLAALTTDPEPPASPRTGWSPWWPAGGAVVIGGGVLCWWTSSRSRRATRGKR